MNTSKESYIKAREAGLIGECQMKVVEYLLEHGEATQREVQLNYNSNVSRTYGTRFKELERSGVIQCVGTRLDQTTNRNVKLYRLLGVPTRRVGSEPKPIKITLDKDLANAVIEAENVCYGEGMGPGGIVWRQFVSMAERVAGIKADG